MTYILTYVRMYAHVHRGKKQMGNQKGIQRLRKHHVQGTHVHAFKVYVCKHTYVCMYLICEVIHVRMYVF